MLCVIGVGWKIKINCPDDYSYSKLQKSLSKYGLTLEEKIKGKVTNNNDNNIDNYDELKEYLETDLYNGLITLSEYITIINKKFLTLNELSVCSYSVEDEYGLLIGKAVEVSDFYDPFVTKNMANKLVEIFDIYSNNDPTRVNPGIGLNLPKIGIYIIEKCL